VGEGRRLFELATEQGVEGVVAKRRASTYVGKRSRDWLKFKVQLTQDGVVGGWTSPEGGRHGFGSLLLGAYERGKLLYIGHVGTGFTGATLTAFKKQLDRLAADHDPFDSPLPPSHARRAHWVKPQIVVTVRFTEWTADGKMRHPIFVGVRDDKRPEDCVREQPLRHETRKTKGRGKGPGDRKRR
jgi:bifunctional non-homologous end joining protein LigD